MKQLNIDYHFKLYLICAWLTAHRLSEARRIPRTTRREIFHYLSDAEDDDKRDISQASLAPTYWWPLCDARVSYFLMLTEQLFGSLGDARDGDEVHGDET